MERTVLLTGATGFVGSAVLAQLLDEKYAVTAVVRDRSATVDGRIEQVIVSDLAAQADLRGVLGGVRIVIHSAGRVHVMNDASSDPLAEFRKVNVDGTLALARGAAGAGVKRFIFISSIKVNGEGTEPGQRYTALDTPAPQDPYAISKMEAEVGLRQIAQETGMELVIIRPVLVYGPGVKANFRSMMIWLNRGLPLPLGAIGNQRSLVSLGNLVDLITTCITHPNAAHQTFLISDGADLSTTEMLRGMSRALGKPSRLLPVPTALLKSIATLLGKGAAIERLCGSLQVDIKHTRDTLNWNPPLSVDEGFRAAATAFLNE